MKPRADFSVIGQRRRMRGCAQGKGAHRSGSEHGEAGFELGHEFDSVVRLPGRSREVEVHRSGMPERARSERVTDFYQQQKGNMTLQGFKKRRVCTCSNTRADNP